jgi:hypothetical protein
MRCSHRPSWRIEYFSTADVLETAKDRAWLVKMSNAISQHWQQHNARKKNGSADLPQDGDAPLVKLSTATRC